MYASRTWKLLYDRLAVEVNLAPKSIALIIFSIATVMAACTFSGMRLLSRVWMVLASTFPMGSFLVILCLQKPSSICSRLRYSGVIIRFLDAVRRRLLQENGWEIPVKYPVKIKK